MEKSTENFCKVIMELAKARLKMDPYKYCGDWTDPELWYIFTDQFYPGHNNSASCAKVMELVIELERAFLGDTPLSINDPNFHVNLQFVFGPKGFEDAGSLRTYMLNPSILPVRLVRSQAVGTLELSDSEVENDVTYAKMGATFEDGVVRLGELHDYSPPKQKTGKKKKVTFEYPPNYASDYAKNPLPARKFRQPSTTIINRTEMSSLYYESTKHLDLEDQTLFHHHMPPGSLTFGTYALMPLDQRKKAITSFVELLKSNDQRPASPEYFLTHHSQRKTHYMLILYWFW